MKRVVLASKLDVSRLGFGTASLHHLYRNGDRVSLLAGALDCGITHFDTAPMYGEGLSERVLGRFLSGGERQRVTLTTKIGFPTRPFLEAFPQMMLVEKALATVARPIGIPIRGERKRCLSVESCERSLHRSLVALQTNWVDILMVHEPLLTEVSEVYKLSEWLNQQKVLGRVRFLGLAGRAKNCVSIARQIPGLFDVLQVEDSIELNEAAAVSNGGWPLQITYGYMRNSLGQSLSGTPRNPLDSVRSALAKNPGGMILVSTTKKHRVLELAGIAAECYAS